MKCEGIVEETTRVIPGVIDPEHPEVMPESTIEIVPAHPCEREADLLARSMEEQVCSLGERHWVKVRDVFTCPLHYSAGTMKHLDGTVTEHPVMIPAHA